MEATFHVCFQSLQLLLHLLGGISQLDWQRGNFVNKLMTSSKTSSNNPTTAKFNCWNLPTNHSFNSLIQKVTSCSQLPPLTCRRGIWGNIAQDLIMYNNDVRVRNSCFFLFLTPSPHVLCSQPKFQQSGRRDKRLTSPDWDTQLWFNAVWIYSSLGKGLARWGNWSSETKQTKNLPHKAKPKKAKLKIQWDVSMIWFLMASTEPYKQLCDWQRGTVGEVTVP